MQKPLLDPVHDSLLLAKPELVFRNLLLIISLGGLFIWVKLMVAELSKKSRESAIKEALNTAPKGLDEMLRHVLESFSRSLSEDEAADLNEMLSWVALAKRPLALGELDAVFRLKSPDGEGLLYLEGKLRKQFASFFTLTREDNLTTADLQAPKSKLADDEDTEAGIEADEGLDDVENETDFKSNLSSTTLSFSHASISDFFRDPKQGKVIASGGDHPPIGVDLTEARVNIAKTCIDLLVDEGLLTRMKDAVSLRPYASNFWKEHLDDLTGNDISEQDRIDIGTRLSRMMQEQSILDSWIGDRNYLFFTADTAKSILEWITDDMVLARLSEDTVTWIRSVIPNSVVLFEHATKGIAENWLASKDHRCYNHLACAAIIFSYVTPVVCFSKTC